MFTKQSGGSSQRHDSRKFPGNRRGRRRRRRGASSTVLSEPISLDNFSHFLAFERSPPLPSSDNNTPMLPYNSKLLSSSREALTLPLREKWRPRGWIRDSRVGERCLPSGDERFIALNRGGSRALFHLERSFDPVEIDVRD